MANTDAYTHVSSDRTNLPTLQTEHMMPDETKAPTLFVPSVRERDELPVLAWSKNLDDNGHPGGGVCSVTYPAYPLYVREKVHPSAFVGTLKNDPIAAQEAKLFHDFNGLPEAAAYEWYKHKGNWQNRIIHGESSQVIASLCDRENLTGRVQMVYFDPPYGIKFNSNFHPSTRKVATPDNRKGMPNSPEMLTAFRDTYKNGIHSYLDQVYEKIMLCRGLLKQSGSMFVQIGAQNLELLTMLCNEVFGAVNRVALIPFATTGASSSKTLPEVAHFLLWYAKEKEQVKYRQLYEHQTRREKIQAWTYAAMMELSDGITRSLTEEERLDPDKKLPENARLLRIFPVYSQGHSDTGRSKPYHWADKGLSIDCPKGSHWTVSMEGLDRLAKRGRLHMNTPTSPLMWKKYENEVPGRKINNLWPRPKQTRGRQYVVQTPASVIERCLLMSTDPSDLVFDPTCGSGTTAAVAEKWGRRWITCDVSPTAVATVRQRITTATFPFWTLADSVDGTKAEAQLSGSKPSGVPSGGYGNDPAKGFVYERVPYVSAATLAYGKTPDPVMLVDRPHKTRGVTRVSSPFTVESINPYTSEPFHIPTPDTESDSERLSPKADSLLVSQIVDNLLGSTPHESDGQKSVFRMKQINEALCDSNYIDYEVIYDSGDRPDARAGLFIAGESVTVSPQMINYAAFDTARYLPGAEMLFVVSFGYDPTEMPTKVGKVEVVRVHPHRDLLISDLKEDSKHAAFVIAANPDIVIHDEKDGKISVEVLGYDSYDPNKGVVTSKTGAEDVACWMIDTNHDSKSFFARRIHFPDNHSNKQLKWLHKTLARSRNKEAWDSMMSLESAPFDKPPPRADRTPGQIAVKIVTHTGTEMTTTQQIPGRS